MATRQGGGGCACGRDGRGDVEAVGGGNHHGVAARSQPAENHTHRVSAFSTARHSIDHAKTPWKQRRQVVDTEEVVRVARYADLDLGVAGQWHGVELPRASARAGTADETAIGKCLCSILTEQALPRRAVAAASRRCGTAAQTAGVAHGWRRTRNATTTSDAAMLAIRHRNHL